MFSNSLEVEQSVERFDNELAQAMLVLSVESTTGDLEGLV